MTRTEEQLLAFCDARWGNKLDSHFLKKAGEELVELAIAYEAGATDEIDDENGDLLLCVLGFAVRRGKGHSELLHRTMEKIEQREYAASFTEKL